MFNKSKKKVKSKRHLCCSVKYYKKKLIKGGSGWPIYMNKDDTAMTSHRGYEIELSNQQRAAARAAAVRVRWRAAARAAVRAARAAASAAARAAERAAAERAAAREGAGMAAEAMVAAMMEGTVMDEAIWAAMVNTIKTHITKLISSLISLIEPQITAIKAIIEKTHEDLGNLEKMSEIVCTEVNSVKEITNIFFVVLESRGLSIYTDHDLFTVIFAITELHSNIVDAKYYIDENNLVVALTWIEKCIEIMPKILTKILTFNNNEAQGKTKKKRKKRKKRKKSSKR